MRSLALALVLVVGCSNAPVEDEGEAEEVRTDQAAFAGVPGFTQRAYSIDLTGKGFPGCSTPGCDLRLRVIGRNPLNATHFEACVVFEKADEPASPYQSLMGSEPVAIGAFRYGATYDYRVRAGLSVPLLGNLHSVEFIVEEGDFTAAGRNELSDRARRDAFGTPIVTELTQRACAGSARARRASVWAWFDQNRDAVQTDRGDLWNAVYSEFRSNAEYDARAGSVVFRR